MNPTTLNLLAVSVFAFMLLSLVGPLLNISPAAVAIALTGCAGVIALDRFSWQGKGSNLLIDLLSGQSSEYRQRILHHEAGHFLAAHLLGIPVQSYTLSAWQGIKAGLPGLGGVIVEQPIEQPVEQPLGSDLESGTAGVEFLSAQQINRSSAEVDTQLRWALLQANTLLEKQQAAYKALVAAMAKQASVAACCEQIETYRISDI